MKKYLYVSSVIGVSLGLTNVSNIERSPMYGQMPYLNMIGFSFAKGFSYSLFWPFSITKMAFDAYECEENLNQHLIPYYSYQKKD